MPKGLLWYIAIVTTIGALGGVAVVMSTVNALRASKNGEG